MDAQILYGSLHPALTSTIKNAYILYIHISDGTLDIPALSKPKQGGAEFRPAIPENLPEPWNRAQTESQSDTA